VVLRKLAPGIAEYVSVANDFHVLYADAFTKSRDYPEDVFPQVVTDTAWLSQLTGGRLLGVRNHISHLLRHHKARFLSLSDVCAQEVTEMIDSFTAQFGRRKNGGARAVTIDGSAYTIFVEEFAHRIDDEEFFGEALFLDDVLTGFTFAGRVGTTAAALYSSMCLVGARGASELLLISLARRLARYGIQYLNLGGSETAGLFHFKRKFGCLNLRSTRDYEFRN